MSIHLDYLVAAIKSDKETISANTRAVTYLSGMFPRVTGTVAVLYCWIPEQSVRRHLATSSQFPASPAQDKYIASCPVHWDSKSAGEISHCTLSNFHD